MKRGNKISVFLSVIIFLLVIPVITTENKSAITGNTITGETITTKTTQSIGINITITAPPSLTLISPENETYLNNRSIPLNYSVSDEEWVKYSLDSGNNITVTSSTYFNASEGSHTLYLYANNSNGLTIRSVNFSVDSTASKIIDDEWKGTKKGNSTNFTIYSYQDIQNLSNVTFEHTDYGKILFNGTINLTNDENPSDNQINISAHINISSNRIEINSSALPNFNKSATLWLYGLSYSDPRILRDGSVCSSAICTRESYSGNVLKFNVTQFTIYSSEETPTEAPGVTPSGGGGGGGAVSVLSIKKFTITSEEIKVSLKQGQTTTKNIIITNNGNQKLSFSITNPKLEEFIKISETDFTLNAGETKVITLDIIAREDSVPNLYIGKLIIKGDSIEKEILVAIEIESAKPLFDVKAEIPQKFRYVMPDEELFAKIEIYNIGDIAKEVDVNVEYKLMDWRGNEIIREEETTAVRTKISYLKEFKIPKDAAFGKYVIYVKVTYNAQVGSASVWFNVGKPPTIPFEIATIALSIFIILTIIIILYKRKIKKPVKRTYKVGEEALKKAEMIKRKKW